jgi:lactam utilization protein B
MFTTTTLQVAAQALAAEVTHLSLHTAGDVSSSADEAAVARVLAAWDVVDGALTAVAAFSGAATDLAVSRVGYWSAAGVYCGGQFLPEGTATSPTGDLEVAVTETGYSA